MNLLMILLLISCCANFESQAVVGGKEVSATEYKNQEKQVERQKKAIEEKQKEYDEIVKEKNKVMDKAKKELENKQIDEVLYTKQIEEATQSIDSAEMQLNKAKDDFKKTQLQLNSLFEGLPASEQSRLVKYSVETFQAAIDFKNPEGALGVLKQELEELSTRSHQEQLKKLQGMKEAINAIDGSAKKTLLQSKLETINNRIAELENFVARSRGVNELDTGKLKLFQKTATEQREIIVKETGDAFESLGLAKITKKAQMQAEALGKIRQLDALVGYYKPSGLEPASFSEGVNIVLKGEKVSPQPKMIPAMEAMLSEQNSAEAFRKLANNPELVEQLPNELKKNVQSKAAESVATILKDFSEGYPMLDPTVSPEDMTKKLASEDPAQAIDTVDSGLGQIAERLNENPIKHTALSKLFESIHNAFKNALNAVRDYLTKMSPVIQKGDAAFDQALKTGDKEEIATTAGEMRSQREEIKARLEKILGEFNAEEQKLFAEAKGKDPKDPKLGLINIQIDMLDSTNAQRQSLSNEINKTLITSTQDIEKMPSNVKDIAKAVNDSATQATAEQSRQAVTHYREELKKLENVLNNFKKSVRTQIPGLNK